MFRQTLFWIHLIAGLISGVVIAIMCFTGTVLTFEKQLVAWSERDARQIAEPTPGSTRLPLDELHTRFRTAHPDARPQSLVISADPLAAVAFSTGRNSAFYVNPYTGEIRQPASIATSSFMRTMTDVHRFLGFDGKESRPRGKLINGICNLAFFLLAVTGLYLWMPRTWSWRTLSPILWFRQNSGAKAREFNWHNVIGLWSAPVLIVLTLTAVPISFRWGGTLIYTLTGTPQPAENAPGSRSSSPPAPIVLPPSTTARALSTDALVTRIQTEFPSWQTITVRLGGAPSAFSATVRESTSWPRTASTTVTLHPDTGEPLKRSGYAEQNAAQQVRSWTRFLHTGEALGLVGQFVAGLACLGGLFLVYTGTALSCRRFFSRRRPTNSGP
jgi:uncharacterized iron-regulated membrane protein